MRRLPQCVELMEKSRYLYIALLATLISVAYWTAFSFNAYNTFHEYTDVAGFANGLYLDIHYAGSVWGPQYIVFDNHLAPDMMFFLPFYYVAPSPVTLLFLQNLILSLTGLMLFFIVKDMFKNERLALAFCLAFLGSAGIYGMLVFDFHTEALMIPLYLIMFYTFMKQNKLGFALASVGFLGIMEFAPFLSLSLGVGLAYFSFRYTDDKALRKRRLIWSGSLILASLIAFALYGIAVGAVISDYSHGMYQTTPQVFRATSQVSMSVSALFGGSGLSQLSQFFSLLPIMIIYGAIVAFLNFGFAIFYEPVITAILALPWFGEAVLLGNANFFMVFDQYYAYILGGILVSVIIGMTLVNERKGFVPRHLEKRFGEKYHKYTHRITLYSLMFFGVTTFLLFPMFVYSKNVNSFSQDFLFQVNQSQQQLYSQLNYMISEIPANAPLMAQFFIMPHVVNREYLEPIGNVTYYFKPKYIISDFNLNISLNAYAAGQPQFLNYYLNQLSRNYTISVVDLASGVIAGSILGFAGPESIDVSGNTLYVVENGTLMAANLEAGRVIGRITLGQDYYPGIAVYDGTAYVTDPSANSVLAANISEGRVAQVAGGLSSPIGIAVSGGDAYVDNLASNSVSVINLSNGSITGTMHGFYWPGGIAVHGGKAYVTNYNSTVSVVNLSTGAITRTIAVGTGAAGIAISGGNAYVVNTYSDTVSVVSLANNSVTGKISGFSFPEDISISGTSAYVTNYGYNYTYNANGTAYLFTRV